MKSLALEIPQDIVISLKLPRESIRQELLKDLAVTLYERDILSFGKARELSQMSWRDFQEELGSRKITRHYTTKELEEDINFVGEDGSK